MGIVDQLWPKDDREIRESLEVMQDGLSEWNKHVFRNVYRKKITRVARLKGTKHILN